MKHLVLQQPAGANELILLFHGVGANAEAMRPLAEMLLPARPKAVMVAVRAPEPSGPGGRQWFSVQGVTDETRPARVAAAMPSFERIVREQQQAFGIDAANTVLVGFSQGGIMALESTQAVQPPLARQVVAIASRFARLPQRAPAGVRFELLHGEADLTIPSAHSVEAAEALHGLGAAVDCDLFPGLAHGIDGRVGRRVVALLRAHGSR